MLLIHRDFVGEAGPGPGHNIDSLTWERRLYTRGMEELFA